MIRASNSLLIARPVEEVFKFVANGENDLKWRPAVVDVMRISDPGLGAIYRQRVRGPLGRQVRADYRVTDYEPNKALAFVAIAGPVRPRGKYYFSEKAGNTELTFSMECQPKGLGRFLSKGVGKAMKNEVGNLDNLKRLLEGPDDIGPVV